MREAEVLLEDGHTLHFYDQGSSDGDGLAVFWLHGTPNIGQPPEPLFADAARLGLRWIGYDRPGYGGSTSRQGRDVASAARDVMHIADQLDIEQFAVMGHSGGGPHALACAALLPGRVLAAISIAGLAPYCTEGLDWFGGMNSSGEAGLRAALAGRAAKEAYETASPEFDRAIFTDADWAALSGPWAWLDKVVGPAVANGPGGLIDDDIAYVTPWGFDCMQISCPVLLLHGGKDRIVPPGHSAWLAKHCPLAEQWVQPDDGHISVLTSASRCLEWLKEHSTT
jgi:pimeloyl-ACP methyl ester carboxylesterase